MKEFANLGGQERRPGKRGLTVGPSMWSAVTQGSLIAPTTCCPAPWIIAKTVALEIPLCPRNLDRPIVISTINMGLPQSVEVGYSQRRLDCSGLGGQR